jgi:ElaB/YqjD/DUF883 family membrane-anchored ribosome-binding protein
MAAKDAEMPTHHALSEEVEALAKHLATIRKDIEGLAGAMAQAGSDQAERVQDAAIEALGAIETAVRRNPTQAIGIALGIGFLVGIVLRR